MKTCTKIWPDIPFAHRAPLHDGHCKLIHGHNWDLEVTFGADTTDPNGFVMDFGKLKDVKAWIDKDFDHALVLNQTDPLLEKFFDFLQPLGLLNITAVLDCSCEGLAKHFYDEVNMLIGKATSGRVRVLNVTLHEDSKNSASYSR